MTPPRSSWRPSRIVGLALLVALGIPAALHLRRPARPTASLFVESKIATVTAPAASPDPGRQLFIQHCSACHQLTGRGIPSVYPPLAGSEWANGPETRIIRVVLHGANGPIEVAGGAFNTLMPPFGALLRDEEIALVLTHVRQEWGNNAPPVAPATVAAVRRATAGRSTAWTSPELLVLP